MTSQDDYYYHSYPSYEEVNPSYSQFKNRQFNEVHGTRRIPSTEPRQGHTEKMRVERSTNYTQNSPRNGGNYNAYRDDEEEPRMTAIKANRGRRSSGSPRVFVSTARRSNSPQKNRAYNDTDEYYNRMGDDYDSNDDEYDDRDLYYNPEDEHYTHSAPHSNKTKTIKVSSSKKNNGRIKTTVMTPSMQKKKRSRATRQDSDTYDNLEPMVIDCESITRKLEHGPFRFRHACLLGGANMILCNFIDWNDDQTYYAVYDRTLMFILVSTYIWVFGLFIVTMEMKPFGKRLSVFHRIVLDFVYMLRFTWGRGIIYFFSGSLQLSLWTRWNIVAGGIMMFLGLVSIIMGRMASHKLKRLVREIGDKMNLSSTFDAADNNRDGYLNVYEFKDFLNLLGVSLNKDELIHLFMAIDRDSDRRLTYDELLYWYATAKKDLKREGITVA
jgi:hypothetical protein